MIFIEFSIDIYEKGKVMKNFIRKNFKLSNQQPTLFRGLLKKSKCIETLSFLFISRRTCNQGNGTTPLYVNVHMNSGETANTWIDALSASFAGVQVSKETKWFLQALQTQALALCNKDPCFPVKTTQTLVINKHKERGARARYNQSINQSIFI